MAPSSSPAPSGRGSSRLGLAIVAAALVAIAVLAVLAVLDRPSGSAPPTSGPATNPPGSGVPSPPGLPPGTFPSPSPATAVLVGAGDIADCRTDEDEATARLLDGIDGTVFTTGDNAYRQGSAGDFARCYGPTWGRHLARTRFPAPGNHDWETDDAGGYLEYFGAAAQPQGATWYSAELGAWHIVVLDSECQRGGRCDEGERQLDWLRQDLAASDARCTLAIWHHPRFSSGFHGNNTEMEALWRALYEDGAEIVLNGHDHNYERFALQDPDGNADPDRGILQIVVGTGGTDLRSIGSPRRNSEARNDDTHGVLRLELGPDGYSYEFVPVAGGTFSDAGSGRCT